MFSPDFGENVDAGVLSDLRVSLGDIGASGAWPFASSGMDIFNPLVRPETVYSDYSKSFAATVWIRWGGTWLVESKLQF